MLQKINKQHKENFKLDWESYETRKVIYSYRYSGEHLIPNLVMRGIKTHGSVSYEPKKPVHVTS